MYLLVFGWKFCESGRLCPCSSPLLSPRRLRTLAPGRCRWRIRRLPIDCAMSIPANDVFSLNSHSHSHSTRRRHSSSMSTRRSLTRSPSPSVFFASTLPSGDSQKRTKKFALRQLSNGAPISENGTLSGVDEVPAHETIQNATTERPEGEPRKEIDWEVPRKLLHSSIGELSLLHAVRVTVIISCRRYHRHPTVHSPDIYATDREESFGSAVRHLHS